MKYCVWVHYTCDCPTGEHGYFGCRDTEADSPEAARAKVQGEIDSGAYLSNPDGLLLSLVYNDPPVVLGVLTPEQSDEVKDPESLRGILATANWLKVVG